VHGALSEHLVEVFTYQDADLLLQGWSARATSVAAWEGLR